MKHQWMPMFWGDFFANTLTLTTASEIGGFVLLLAHAWEHGRIADADAQKIARIDNRHWQKRVRAKLVPLFELETDSQGKTWWYSKRILRQLAIADELSSKRRAAGMAGAIKRWGSKMANAMPPKWQSHSNLQSKKDKPTNGEIQQPFPPVDNHPPTEPDQPSQEVAEKKKPEDMTLTEINQRWRGPFT